MKAPKSKVGITSNKHLQQMVSQPKVKYNYLMKENYLNTNHFLVLT